MVKGKLLLQLFCNYCCHLNNLALSLKDLYLCKKYDRLSEAWVQRMDRIENNPKKR